MIAGLGYGRAMFNLYSTDQRWNNFIMIKSLKYISIFSFVFLLSSCGLSDSQPIMQNVNNLSVNQNEQLKDQFEIISPVAEFNSRITKKPFGIFITQKDSPIQPERFTGYHTGIDVEYEDVESEVKVFAIADGVVEHSGWVSGYGGVLAIRHFIDGKTYLAIYGHLNPDSLIKNGTEVLAGEQIGVLGQGFSHETDNERKHLHFALYTGSDINLRGYVSNIEQLSAWIDPQILLGY